MTSDPSISLEALTSAARYTFGEGLGEQLARELSRETLEALMTMGRATAFHRAAIAIVNTLEGRGHPEAAKIALQMRNNSNGARYARQLQVVSAQGTAA